MKSNLAEAYLQEDYIFILLFPLKATRLKINEDALIIRKSLRSLVCLSQTPAV